MPIGSVMQESVQLSFSQARIILNVLPLCTDYRTLKIYHWYPAAQWRLCKVWAYQLRGC